MNLLTFGQKVKSYFLWLDQTPLKNWPDNLKGPGNDYAIMWTAVSVLLLMSECRRTHKKKSCLIIQVCFVLLHYLIWAQNIKATLLEPKQLVIQVSNLNKGAVVCHCFCFQAPAATYHVCFDSWNTEHLLPSHRSFPLVCPVPLRPTGHRRTRCCRRTAEFQPVLINVCTTGGQIENMENINKKQNIH